MPGSFSIGGLASGLDTQSILSSLISLERRPIILLNGRKDDFIKRQDAWKQVNSKLQSLKSVIDDIRKKSDFNLYITETDDTATKESLSLTATSSASAGSHSVIIMALASAQKYGSSAFTSKTTALNLSGEFLVNQKAVSISSTDDLVDIVDKINNANAKATASIIQVDSTDFRLIINGDNEGVDSLDLMDASTADVLQSLGFHVSSSVSIKHLISNGAQSDTFSDNSSAIGGIYDLSSPPSGTVTINDKTVAIDLSTDSLSDIRDNINTAAPTGVTASIVTTTENGSTVYKLKIAGTTTFIDVNNVLQTIGVLEGDRTTAQQLTGSVANTEISSSNNIIASTTFDDITGASVVNGDTITISGTDHSGDSVSSTFTITNKSTQTVQDLLTAIQDAYNGEITASVDVNGKIVVTNNTSGTSNFVLTLTENNEGAGALDFGTFSTTVTGGVGESGELEAGRDNSLIIDGIKVTRNTNSISDILSGTTLDLKKADSTKTIIISVTRDYDAIIDNVEKFVTEYNKLVDFISEQFTYDEETEEAGVLFGDVGLTSVQNGIRAIISDRNTALPSALRSLSQVGIDTDRNGKLSLDSNKFLEEIKDDFDGVMKIFSAFGSTTDGDVTFVSHTKSTNAGTYAVNITQAATQGALTGTTDLTAGIAGAEVLTITDKATSQIASVSIASGADIDAIVSQINAELAKEHKQIKTSTGTILESAAAATSLTVWTNTDHSVTVGDTISISGKTHRGQSVSGTYTIASGDTVQKLLNKIQDIYQNTVNASIDSNGAIVVTNNETGSSNLDITLTANNEGAGSLDFSTMSLTQTGRYSINMTASNSSGNLKLTHNDHGLSNGFTISQSVNNLGMADAEYLGQDVAGTINGESATGKGQFLTGDADESNIDSLVLKVSITTSQLTTQGASQGNITLTLGVAEQLFNHIENITDSFTGFVSTKQDSLKDTVDNIQKQIDAMEIRVGQKISTLELRFINLEIVIAQMNSLSSFLTAQLALL